LDGAVTDDHAVVVDEISVWNRSSSPCATLLAEVRERMLSAAAGKPLPLMALPAALEAIQLAEATLLPVSLPATAWLKAGVRRASLGASGLGWAPEVIATRRDPRNADCLPSSATEPSRDRTLTRRPGAVAGHAVRSIV
jgi:hypothetical protein